MQSIFVTTDWLASHLTDPAVVILDASWYLPTANRNPHAEYLAGHIPGAIFFDIDAIADTSAGLPHMLLSPPEFARQVGALGISDAMTIVIYDEAGLFSAPRVWWEFATMGAPDIRILEGGGPQWRAESRPLETGSTQRPPATFIPRLKAELLRDFDQVKSALAAQSTVVDARPAGRFAGRDPEPRPGAKSGHMPGALSVPASDLVENGKLKSPHVLQALFAEAGVDLTRPIITTCGSGVTASTLKLALMTAGAINVAVYDGSWAEWGTRPDAVVVKD